MRDIEFRAEFKDEFIFWSIYDESNWFWEVVRNNDLKAEQYIGEKDSAGKKIFEGDIINAQHNLQGCEEDEVAKGIVEFVPTFNCYVIQDKETKLVTFFHQILNPIVVGNVHEGMI